jgi:hypothetical protein
MGSVLRLMSLAGAAVLIVLVILTLMAIFGSGLDHSWSDPPV